MYKKLLFIAFLGAALGIALYLEGLLRSNGVENSPFQKKKDVNPDVGQSIDKFEDVNNLVTQSCASRYQKWSSITLGDTVTVKIPPYFYINSGGVGNLGLIANHPKLGMFTLSSSLIGDFDPPDVDGFESRLEHLMNLRQENFKQPSYYKDTENHYYVIGEWGAIVAQNARHPRWWMLTITSQDITAIFPQKEKELIAEVDFKCFLRSASFK